MVDCHLNDFFHELKTKSWWHDGGCSFPSDRIVLLIFAALGKRCKVINSSNIVIVGLRCKLMENYYRDIHIELLIWSMRWIPQVVVLVQFRWLGCMLFLGGFLNQGGCCRCNSGGFFLILGKLFCLKEVVRFSHCRH